MSLTSNGCLDIWAAESPSGPHRISGGARARLDSVEPSTRCGRLGATARYILEGPTPSDRICFATVGRRRTESVPPYSTRYGSVEDPTPSGRVQITAIGEVG